MSTWRSFFFWSRGLGFDECFVFLGQLGFFFPVSFFWSRAPDLDECFVFLGHLHGSAFVIFGLGGLILTNVSRFGAIFGIPGLLFSVSFLVSGA